MSDETAFVEAILADPEDEAPRLIYADWLEERGDIRGEFLRVEQALAGLPEADPRYSEMRCRLDEVRRQIDVQWVALVDRTKIEGCPQVELEGRYRIKFDVECPKRWEGLKRTHDNLIRYCEECKKRVFYCPTMEDAQRHAQFGHCIAVDSHAERTEFDVRIALMRDPDRRLLVLGRPAPPAPRFRPGQRVRIRSGPFAGTLGEINRLRLAHLRATVEFVVGGQRTEQEVNFEEIEPLR